MSVPRFEIFEISGAKRRFVGVAAGRGSVGEVENFIKKIYEIGKNHGVAIQVFDANMVAGAQHLIHAAKHASLTHESGRGFASSLELELVCWVSAESQIGRAISKVGVKKGECEVALVAVGASSEKINSALEHVFSKLGLSRDDRLLKIGKPKIETIKKSFSISSRELETSHIEKIVAERVSLLGLQS